MSRSTTRTTAQVGTTPKASTTRRRTATQPPKPLPEIILGAEPEYHLSVPDRRHRAKLLSEDEARDLTDEIRRTVVRLWLLVTEAHDRQAHLAMGYDTWADYVKAELKMSESRSYQLIDTGHVMRELGAAGANVEEVEPPTARVVARVKDRLADVRKATLAAISKGEDPGDAIRALAAEVRPPSRVATATVPEGEEALPDDDESLDYDDEAQDESPGPEVEDCPACEGSGEVDVGFAVKLRTALRKLRPQ